MIRNFCSAIVFACLLAMVGCAATGNNNAIPAANSRTGQGADLPGADFLSKLRVKNALWQAYATRYPTRWHAGGYQLRAKLALEKSKSVRPRAGISQPVAWQMKTPSDRSLFSPVTRADYLPFINSWVFNDIAATLTYSRQQTPDALLIEYFGLIREQLTSLRIKDPLSCQLLIQGKGILPNGKSRAFQKRKLDIDARIIRDAGRGQISRLPRVQVQQVLFKVKQRMAAKYPHLEQARFTLLSEGSVAQAAKPDPDQAGRQCQLEIDRLAMLDQLPANERIAMYRVLVGRSIEIATMKRWRTVVALLPESNAALLAGNLGLDVVPRLRALLRKKPTIDTLLLDSPGGLMMAGAALGNLIDRHKLNTHVTHLCASACTVALMAGKQRSASPHATIGFHDSSEAGFSLSEQGVELAQYRRFYKGMPDSFLQRIRATPRTSLWVPDHQVLIRVGVLTQLAPASDPQQLARLKEFVDSERRVNPAMNADMSLHQGHWVAELDRLSMVLKLGASDDLVNRYLYDEFNARLREYWLSTPDAVVDEALELVKKKLQFFSHAAPAGCLVSFLGSTPTANVRRITPRELLADERKLMTRIVQQQTTAKSAISVNSTQQRKAGAMAPEVVAFLAGLPAYTRQWMNENLPLRPRPLSDPGTCQALTALTDELLKLPAPRRGRFFRALQASVMRWYSYNRYDRPLPIVFSAQVE